MASILLEMFSGSKAMPLKPLNLNLVPVLLFIFVAGLERGSGAVTGRRLHKTKSTTQHISNWSSLIIYCLR